AAILLLTEEADSISDCHTRTLGDWAGEPEAKAHYDHVRSVVDALSQLRAPVADERALDLLDTLFTAYESGTPCYEEPDSQGGYLGMAFRIDDDTFRACADLLNKHRPRAALASAPVPVLKDWRIDTSAGGPILVYKDCSVIESAQAEYVLRLIAADQASAPVAEEAKVQIEYLDMDNHRLRRALQKLMARLTDLLDEDQFANCESIVTAAGVEPPASTPVAGEAKNYPGDNVAERLDKMADGQPPGSQAQSDLYAAATIWRKHIAHRAAPQASAVAGEAVTWEAVRQELAIFLMGATGRSSKEWHRPLDNASEGGALARMRACLAAPQASAENVRNAALEEAIQAVSGITTSYAVFTSGNPQYRPESRPASAAIAEAIETLRALKRSQADKDGGQQRAGDAFPDYMHDLRYHDQFRIGWNRCVDAYRAALSASQAEQGEREDG
ncbi:hypothetical protein, partial [Achromobacter xylosoxidans]